MTQVMMKEAWRKSVWQFHRHIHTSASIKVTLFCQFIFTIKFILLRTKTLLHIIINSKLIRLFFTVFVLISTIVNVVIVFNVINQTLEKIHIRASLTDRFSWLFTQFNSQLISTHFYAFAAHHVAWFSLLIILRKCQSMAISRVCKYLSNQYWYRVVVEQIRKAFSILNKCNLMIRIFLLRRMFLYSSYQIFFFVPGIELFLFFSSQVFVYRF